MSVVKYIINKKATIREALVALDGNTHDWQTLFVVDEGEKMVGTLTDGDIRRGLIKGLELSDTVEKAMHTNFKFVREGQNDALQLKSFREKQIFFVPVLDADNHVVRVYNLIKYHNFLPVDAVLMAGGKGERLRPLTEKIPKPLLPVGDKAIIDHNVDRLISYGVKNISVTVNYLAEQIESHYAQPRNEVQIQCVREPKFLGTMGAVRFVKEFHNDVVLVMNSDLFTDIDLEDFYLHFMDNGADMSIAAVPYNVSVPYGIFDLDGRNVVGLQEKPVYNYYANAGIYLLKRFVLDEIPQDVFFNATDFIEKLIKEHKSVIRYPLKGTWIDIGTVSEYQKAQDLAKHI